MSLDQQRAVARVDLARQITTTPVIILTWNGWEAVFACLRSIRESGEAHLVWLVDNGSPENRVLEARSLYTNLRAFRWDENRGWAGGYNPALQRAMREGHDFAYLLNDDCIVTPDFLAATLAAALAGEEIALVGSYLADTDGLLVFDGTHHPPGARMAQRETVVRLVPEVHGAAMLVRLCAVREVGYFAERYFCYGEETEWCRRARRAGWLVAATGESLVYHRGSASDLAGNARYYRTRNGFWLLEELRPENRWRIQARYTYRSLRAANEARRRGDTETAEAIASGLWDGWRGRDGRRGEPPSQPIRNLLTHCWPLPAGFFRGRGTA